MPRVKRSGPTILVTDARLGSAIAIVRSLGRQGWRVIAADSDPRSPAFRSRYVEDRLLYPAPEREPHEFVNTMVEAVRLRNVDLLIPVTDQVILPLSRERARFEGICKLALPDADALQVVTDKSETIRLAERLGVPVPRTRLVHTVQEARACGSELGWPVVLKPLASQVYRATIEAFTVCYAENRDELAMRMQVFDGRCPVLLQEYYQGTGYGVELLLYQGRPLAAFQHQRLRELPINGGASTFRQSVSLDPTLYHHAESLLGELKWTGLAMVEFKVGDAGAKLMEINGRIWGSLPLAVHSGMDFPCRLVELYFGGLRNGAAKLDTAYTVGVRSRNLELDLIWIAQVLRHRPRYPFLPMPRRRQALAALLGLFNPANRFDILSLRDPWPSQVEFSRIIARFAAKLKEAVQKTRSRRRRPLFADAVSSPIGGQP